jgi:hypothetical protein
MAISRRIERLFSLLVQVKAVPVLEPSARPLTRGQDNEVDRKARVPLKVKLNTETTRSAISWTSGRSSSKKESSAM